MASFNNLKDLEKWLQEKTHGLLNNSMEIERLLAEEMSQAVYDAVYAYYEPETYERRMDDGGLSDTRNYEISSVTAEGNSVRLVFENLTQGNDNLKHTFIGELIEYGGEYGQQNGLRWQNPDGEWSDPRPFSALATERLKEGKDLVNILKKEFSQIGIKTE